jgi:hypothetical protein
MTSWLISITYGGDTASGGLYRPRQIPFTVDVRLSAQRDGQTPYALMAANAAAFCYSATGDVSYLSYARVAFQDYIRYAGVTGGDEYVDAGLRTPTSYDSNVYNGTESKIHGWSNRYGQYLLAVERSAASSVPVFLAQVAVGGGFTTVFTFSNTGDTAATGNLSLTDQKGNTLPVVLSGATIPQQSGLADNRREAAGSIFPLSIPPGGTQIFTARAVDPLADITNGWARLESAGGKVEGVGTFQVAERGSLKSIAGVLASPAAEFATIPIDNDDGQKRYTGFAVANTGSENINIRIVTLKEDGTVVDSINPPDLNPLGPQKQIAGFLHQYLSNKTTFRGSMVLQADSGKKFAVVALLLNKGLFTAIPVILAKPSTVSN